MRKDERLKTIYETAAQMIVRSEGAWRDYLRFASRIHKHDFDTALLVYAQNDSVTALASMAQWNRIGRYVNKGASGIAVCEYDNAKLTVSYLFDISQTSGREVRMTDWRLNEDMKAELAQRFIRADGIQADTFAEMIYALAAEGTAEKYETCLRSLKGNIQDHIFSELPGSGLEAQLISLLTDSAAYLIGKRCGLPDEEIQIGDGMQTISHFNTIPLLAALGNTVMAVARERLMELEWTIKTIQMERSQKHGEQGKSQLHRERRNPVSESANIQRPEGRPAAGEIRENGAGIFEGAASRPIYSFENGWQSDGDHAPGAGGSGGKDRDADAAAAPARPAAGESRYRPADRGYAGEGAPPEQFETAGGGNGAAGNRADPEISDRSAETGLSKDGPVSLSDYKMPDGEIRRHVRYVLTSTNLYPPELHNAMRRLLSGQPADRNRRETAKEACRIFSEYGNREYQGEVLYRTELRGKAGMAMSFGANGYTYLSWNAIANAVHTLIAAGEYPEEIETPNEIPEYTDALVTGGSEAVHLDAETEAEITVQKPGRKNSRESRNYQTFARLFPDVLSKKYQYLHLESDGFEPLSLEWLSGGELSMMHTYEQNGDLMRDPDMVLRINTEEQTIQAASFEQSSLGLYQEVFTEAGCDMKLMKELDDFLSQWLSNIAVQGYAPVRAIEAVNGEEQEILFNKPETAATEPGLPADEEPAQPSLEQMSLFSGKPEEEDDSRARDEAVLLLGSNVEGSKQRIYKFALTQPSGSTFVTFLKKEYGIGGHSYDRHGISFVNYDSKGIRYDLEGGDRITLSWKKAAAIIQRLVNEGRYLDTPVIQTQAREPEAEASVDEPDEEIKVAEEVRGTHHGQIDMEMTAYKGETAVGYIQYSLYENVPHIAFMETMPPYRRQGIATRLLRQLQAQYPDTEIEWGMLTDDGRALYEAVTYSVENEEYVHAQEGLKGIISRLSQYESAIDNGGNLTDAQAAEMAELESAQNWLEKELRDLRPTRVYIRPEENIKTEGVSASEQKDDLEASVLQPFRYIPGTDLYPRGDKSKYQANVTAIKLLRHIEAERRPATPEEQTVLARYCGWGGLSNAFNDKSG